MKSPTETHRPTPGGPFLATARGGVTMIQACTGPPAPPSNSDPSNPHKKLAKKIKIPTKIILILNKMGRMSLFRRFHFKRNAPDDSKQYEITKQTHRACSVLNQTNGAPRFQRPRSDMNKDSQDIQDGLSFILLILSILVTFSYLPPSQPRKTNEAQEGDRGTPMFPHLSSLSSLPSVHIFRSLFRRRPRSESQELNVSSSAFIRVHPWFYNVHSACSTADPTNGTPRFRPRRPPSGPLRQSTQPAALEPTGQAW